jgi:hypothetical protein
MTDYKVCSTADLLALNDTALGANLNRALDAKENADPEGVHVFQMVLYGHNMDHHPILHHRARGLVKVKGTEAPETVYLDIPDELWQKLQTPEELEASQPA